jgi:hypothetical protein
MECWGRSVWFVGLLAPLQMSTASNSRKAASLFGPCKSLSPKVFRLLAISASSSPGENCISSYRERALGRTTWTDASSLE